MNPLEAQVIPRHQLPVPDVLDHQSRLDLGNTGLVVTR